jgi:hypothetical protein
MKYILALAPISLAALLPELAQQIGTFLWCNIDARLAIPCFLGSWDLAPGLSSIITVGEIALTPACWLSLSALSLCVAHDRGWLSAKASTRVGSSA